MASNSPKESDESILKYGVATSMGKNNCTKKTNNNLVNLPKPGLELWSYFAVFDGNDGPYVNDDMSKNLIESILNADVELFEYFVSNHSKHISFKIETRIKTAIHKAYSELHKQKKSRNDIKGIFEPSNIPYCACLISPTHIYLIHLNKTKHFLFSNGQIKQSVTKSPSSNQVNLSEDIQLDIEVYEKSSEDEFIVLVNESLSEISDMNYKYLNEYIHYKLKITHNLANICKEVIEVCFDKVCLYYIYYIYRVSKLYTCVLLYF